MKDLIRVAAIFLCIVYVGEYLKKNNLDLYDVFKVERPVRVETSKSTDEIVTVEEESPKVTRNDYDNRPVIVVRALGNVDNGDLDYAADVIKDFYGYKVKIGSRADIDNSMYNENGELQSLNTCISLGSSEKTLYITDRKLYDADGVLLRGAASTNNKTIVVRGEQRFMRETIIHEIGHTLGLDHCDDLTCVMATHNDAYDSGDFCNSCKRKIGF